MKIQNVQQTFYEMKQQILETILFGFYQQLLVLDQKLARKVL